MKIDDQPANSVHSSASTAPWHTMAAQEVVQQLSVNPVVGMSSDQVLERRTQTGLNALAEAPPEPLWKKLLNQFRDLVIWILIVAGVISGVMKEWADTISILAIVVLNGIIGFLQEERAERALAALQKLSSPTTKVLRDGSLHSIPASELVPGDCIELEAGDNIPADARLLSAYGFSVQEAALTGESQSAEKDAHSRLTREAALGDRRNMVYMGTVTATGKATAVVVAIGMNTELGHIAGLLQRSERELTPLQRRLAELGKVLVGVCLTIVVVIFFLHLWRGGNVLETLLISVSLAVAAVPEGLPAVVTLTLALGVQRMVKRNALVRKLPSVETLGSVTVICSDKTGTLTRNEMTVREIIAGSVRFYITGSGYLPRGDFHRRDPSRGDAPLPTDSQPVNPQDESDLMQLLITSVRCNNASVDRIGNGDETWQVTGDPTEGSLIVAAMKAGIELRSDGQETLLEIPFDSERKAMSVVVQLSDGQVVMYTKGAPEIILAKCVSERRDSSAKPLTDERRRQIMQSGSELAAQALRVLAFAYRDQLVPPIDEAQETDLIFVGLVGMIDPPREEAREAVRKCREAGIRPVMITGDHPETALAIARELEIAAPDSLAMTGQQLDAVSDEQLADRADSISVFARVSPEHKLRVVRALKARGHVVAMTGDGVNDAPAVKAADIGIAMGITGTDVTREASDMVLMDDNFATIVNAVEEGRGIFDNIQKFVHFLLACNTGEVLLMFVAALIGWPVPLVAIQILWINLVTDGLPALALGMEPPEPDIMSRPPRPAEEPVLSRHRGLLILFHGSLVATVAGLGFWMIFQGEPDNLSRARTVTFTICAFSQLFFAVGCRSQRFTMPKLGLFTNPYLISAIAVSGLLQVSVLILPFAQPVFEVAANLTWEWILILVLSLIPVTVVELTKMVQAMRGRL